MELSDLKILCEVVSSGGVTAAANKLHRVPSAITTRVKQLEDEIGKSLFERVGKKMVLTSDGEVLYAYGLQMLALAEKALAEVSSSVDRGTLKIGAMDAVTFKYSKQLGKYHEKYPGVSLTLAAGSSPELIQKVRSGELDAAILLNPEFHDGLSSILLSQDQAMLISDNSVGAIKSPTAISDKTLLVFRSGCPYRVKLEDWLSSKGIRPKSIVEIHSYHAMIGCVVAGMGVAIVPETILAGYPKTSGFTVHELPKAFGNGELHLVFRGDMPSAKLQRLSDLLLNKRTDT